MVRRTPNKLPVALIALLCALCFTCTAMAAATIPYGDISDEVRVMQQALKEKGYFDETVDGVFGPETLVAICKYQSAVGLKVDGIPGERTLTKLYQKKSTQKQTAAAKTTRGDSGALSLGSHGQRVKKLQRALRANGYYCGSVDGCYGARTCAAVEQYQWDHRLVVDGVAGGETWTSLFGGTDASLSAPVYSEPAYPVAPAYSELMYPIAPFYEAPPANPDEWLLYVDAPPMPDMGIQPIG